MMCHKTMALYMSSYTKDKENEWLTVGGLNFMWDIHQKAWFPMIKLFSHQYVIFYKWPSCVLGWEE